MALTHPSLPFNRVRTWSKRVHRTSLQTSPLFTVPMKPCCDYRFLLITEAMLSQDDRTGCGVVMKQGYILRRIKVQAREGSVVERMYSNSGRGPGVSSSHFRHRTTVCNSSSEGSDALKSPALMCVHAQTHKHTGYT